MSDLTDAATNLSNAATRANKTTDFFDDVTTLGPTSTVKNPNNNKTVPSVQKQVKDLFDSLPADDSVDALQAAAIAVGAKYEEVIATTNTTTVLDDVLYIYDASEQVTYAVPADVGLGEVIVSVDDGVLTTDESTYALKSINKSGLIFETIEDIDNGNSIGGKVNLIVGDTVIANDYATGNNSGVLFFKVVAGGTGADDGGKYIDLSSGLQLEQNLKKPYNVKAWGAKGDNINDDTSSIKSTMAFGSTTYAPEGEYKVTDLITIPDDHDFFGDGVYSTYIKMETALDIDVIQIGWYTTVKDMSIWQDNTFAINSGLSKGVIRMQSLTNSEIPTNVSGNDWTDPAIGGLSYYNKLENLELKYGQNYNLYCVNGAYNDISTVRSVLSKGPSGNFYIWGNGGGSGFPSTTTTNLKDCKSIAGLFGDGITLFNVESSTIDSCISEGNYGRALLIEGSLNVTVKGPSYFENNFASSLGASTGDGDITVVNSDKISLQDPRILGNNSNYGVTSSGSSGCALVGGFVSGLNSTPKPLNIPGWQYSASPTTIHDHNRSDGDWKWTKFADGSAIITLNREFTGVDISLARGAVFGNSVEFAISDFPFGFVSNGASGFEMEYSVSILDSGAHFIWTASNGASLLNNAIRLKLFSPTSTASASFTLQAIIRAYWR